MTLLKNHPKLPKHVALIMDGNGRWAQGKNLPPIAGHKAGADVARAIVEKAHALGISYLTLYTFSTENWNREPTWIEDMMSLLRHYLTFETQSLIDNNIQFRIIGDVSQFPQDIQDLIGQIETKSQQNTGLTLLMALGYGGRDEIMRAVHKIQSKGLSKEELTPEVFASFLDTHNIPDPDLLIRTSGEKRLSNFLLWQLAYAELIFVEDYWPDFTPELFEKALEDYLTEREDMEQSVALKAPSSSFGGNLGMRLLSAAFGIPLVGLIWHLGGIYFDCFMFLLLGLTVREWAKLNLLSSDVPLLLRLGLFVCGLIYITLAFCVLLPLYHFDKVIFAYLICLVWATDTGAYFVGKIIAGPKPSFLRKISPNKTWSGFVGSSLIIVFFLSVFYYLQPLNFMGPFSFIGGGFLLSIAAHGGDLLESAVKRFYKVKDSGSLIPGHGGMLDRLDSLMGASIVFAFLWIVFTILC